MWLHNIKQRARQTFTLLITPAFPGVVKNKRERDNKSKNQKGQED